MKTKEINEYFDIVGIDRVGYTVSIGKNKGRVYAMDSNGNELTVKKTKKNNFKIFFSKTRKAKP